jgi:hypothetical protein
MKANYLLECYDTLLNILDTQNSISSSSTLEELLKIDFESYRIYTIVLIGEAGEEQVKIKKPIHSLHPKALKLDFESPLMIHELINHIQAIKKRIKLTGEPISFAKHPSQSNIFYIYEKCSLSDLSSKERLFLYCHHKTKKENQAIQIATKEKVFSLNSPEKIQLFVHKLQTAIDCQLNLLYRNINPKVATELYEFSNEYSKTDCEKAIYTNLEKILIFIEKEYKDYLNLSIQVPKSNLLATEAKVFPKLNFVRGSLLATEINQELLAILFEPIQLLSTINTQDELTYYQFNYASEYIKELAILIEKYPHELDEKILCGWLIELNCNSYKFFDYITNMINEEIKNCESESECLNILFKKLKKINQTKSKIKVFSDRNLPDLKLQVCDWIEEEIEFFNRKINLEKHQSGSIKLKEQNTKIQTSFSVAQLGFFINIMVKSGIIKHPNQREILKVITDNFRTSATENISTDSLSSKYYNVESSTKQAVREKIIELLNLSKS